MNLYSKREMIILTIHYFTRIDMGITGHDDVAESGGDGMDHLIIIGHIKKKKNNCFKNNSKNN